MMPARAQGSTYKTRSGHGIRWYEDGARRHKSGFDSRSAARSYFQDVVRPRLDGLPATSEPLTLRQFSERYIARYEAIRAPASVRSLRYRLVRPLAEFGDTPLAELRVGEIAAWEASLPPRFRHDVMRAFSMVCRAAVDWGQLERNPAKTGPNPSPAVIEREILTPVEVDALAGEMEPLYGAAALVGAWCFLRPSELLGLERRDIDLDAGLLHVRGTKTARSQRSVPMPQRARQALADLPARVDTRLVFPAPVGGRYELNNFRPREFAWAVAAAGLPESVTPYTLRHSGLSWALAAGIPAVDVARYGGTSVTMLERVYHHLLVSSAASARARMDQFMAASGSARLSQDKRKPRACGVFSRCARHDSNMRPLPPQGSALSPELRARGSQV
jgi:integrase